MKNSFEISVILPTYNRKYTLQRSIDSILNQTYRPSEIIIIDDGSSDGSTEWLADLCSKKTEFNPERTC